ncbi:hypothetical protein T4E_1224 [Trichinella pseudospiralis]|uniref:Uncharacterized protein n=1 Tax=Trichinella pseudospiralis TaxID=6337 RepID=A0A0V0XHD0_TRIPS|nr:hypothetical protein T4E_9100 [Trichinella pseudospiralis]KRX89316.1 hypothetical protein T4E_1224 [Trichinella pseudospiralis]
MSTFEKPMKLFLENFEFLCTIDMLVLRKTAKYFTEFQRKLPMIYGQQYVMRLQWYFEEYE